MPLLQTPLAKLTAWSLPRKWLCSILLLLPILCKAQDTDKRVRFFPFPVVYYAPETRFVFGVGGNVTFRFKKDLAAKPSTLTFGAAYSQNKQLLLYAPFQIFFDSNKYYFFGEVGYYKYSYNFYGTGINEVPAELYSVNFPRIKLNATRLVAPHVYLGLRYQFEHYDIQATTPGGTLEKGTVPGSGGSVVSGIGIQTVYDTRDSVLYPSSGFYAEGSMITHGKYTGSTHTFSRAIVDVAYYKHLNKFAILALNSYNSFVIGEAPFQQQSLLGGNKKMRGYYEGRYIDKNLCVLQAEGRFTVYRRWGAVLFGNCGALGGNDAFLRVNDVKYTAGGGLRFTINRKDHLNARLDYAIGPGTSGIYFTIGEAF